MLEQVKTIHRSHDALTHFPNNSCVSEVEAGSLAGMDWPAYIDQDFLQLGEMAAVYVFGFVTCLFRAGLDAS